MALYDAKIERFSKKATEIRRRRVFWKAPDIAWDVCTSLNLSLCEKLNCDGEKLEIVLAREHEQIQNMKARGLTDDEIDDLGKAANTKNK